MTSTCPTVRSGLRPRRGPGPFCLRLAVRPGLRPHARSPASNPPTVRPGLSPAHDPGPATPRRAPRASAPRAVPSQRPVPPHAPGSPPRAAPDFRLASPCAPGPSPTRGPWQPAPVRPGLQPHARPGSLLFAVLCTTIVYFQTSTPTTFCRVQLRKCWLLSTPDTPAASQALMAKRIYVDTLLPSKHRVSHDTSKGRTPLYSTRCSSTPVLSVRKITERIVSSDR